MRKFGPRARILILRGAYLGDFLIITPAPCSTRERRSIGWPGPTWPRRTVEPPMARPIDERLATRYAAAKASMRDSGRRAVRLTISQLTNGTTVSGEFYAVQEARIQHKKDGSPFLRARLRDATGTIDAVSWEEVEQRVGILQAGRVVKVRGPVARAYSGDGLELTIQQIRLAQEHEYHLDDFLPCAAEPPETMIDELRALLNPVRQPLQAAVWAALDPELPRFARWPAAQDLHHAWLGGLLEHSLEVARIALSIAAVVPGLDRDLLIAGAILHDVGKLDAYHVGATFQASDAGRLIGHILTGFHRVQLAASQVQLPDDDALRLLHIIASHHGQVEFGAAREPMTGEAIVIHFSDELSAQLMQARAAAESRAAGARWTERAKGLKRDLFLGSPERPATT